MMHSRHAAFSCVLAATRRGIFIALAACACAAGISTPAHALRVATWNVLKYPDVAVPARQTYMRTVMAALDPDVIFCQEMMSAAGKDSFLLDVLGVVQPGQWTGQWLDVGSGEGMGAFWKTSKATLFNFSAITTSSGPRKILLCGVRVPGYPNSAFFRAYSMHLKAGDGSLTPSDSTTRRLECTDLRTQLNAVPANTPFLLMGDSNFYGAYETGYVRLTESQADNDGRSVDPLGLAGAWHDNSSYRLYDTQCPCSSGCLDPAFSGGGMDDRFDVLFTSTAMQDGAGFDMVPGSTVAYGNDGLHFNTDINGDGFNNAVGFTVATAIRNSSDHIPVYIDVQVPARVQANSMLDFGRVITGGAATQNLSVADAALPPADELNYSLIAPAGFTAPAGSFTANASAVANTHAIGIDTAAPGIKNGTLTVSSNAADTASKLVLLGGTVLRHASASLDSVASITSSSLDFGANAILHFDRGVRVHNRGFDALQAQLALNTAAITGGNGRFSIVGGFSPIQLGGTGTTLTLRFDSYGATLDSTYDAVLTITGADEPLPGGIAAATLTVTLSATPVSGVLGTGTAAQGALRFVPARPNPLSHETTFAFDLPRAQRASLEIYDLGGRRVATLASGDQGAGHHELSWHATDSQGARVPGGLYFARFNTPGLVRFERLVVLP